MTGGGNGPVHLPRRWEARPRKLRLSNWTGFRLEPGAALAFEPASQGRQEKMERRGFLARGAAGATALAAPSIAAAQPQVQWRCAGSFPKSTDVLWGVLELLSRRVAELTSNAFQIRIFAAGELVPALQVLDAVGGGTVECGHTAAYYYIGK